MTNEEISKLIDQTVGPTYDREQIKKLLFESIIPSIKKQK